MFILSKILTAITQPMFWLVLWLVIALLILNRCRRYAVIMLWSGVLMIALLGFRTVPDYLLRALESQYPIPSADAVSRHAGVIVLGGAFDETSSFIAHGQVPLASGAERMTVPLPWMRKNAQMELIFSGGEGTLLTTGITESQMAQAFYQEQGLDMRRVHLESSSRTTRENARMVAKMLGARCTQNWLLVTSAWHMPRAMAEFETEFGKMGCHVTPYPVDFQTGASTPWTEYSLAKSLMQWQRALHEYLGLVAYRLTR